MQGDTLMKCTLMQRGTTKYRLYYGRNLRGGIVFSTQCVV